MYQKVMVRIHLVAHRVPTLVEAVSEKGQNSFVNIINETMRPLKHLSALTERLPFCSALNLGVIWPV